MEFTYDGKKNVIESEDPNVYVKPFGFHPGGKVWVLYNHDQRIGFYSQQQTIKGENIKTDKSDFKIVNWILSVGEAIPPHTALYKFQASKKSARFWAF